MTNKETKRERREEAKKARMAAVRRAKRKSFVRKVYGTLITLAIMGLIAFLVISSGTGGRDAKAALATAATAAGCDAPKEVPQMPTSAHINPPATEKYNNNPPTSGRHYVGPANAAYFTGVHTNEVQDEYFVHNLEHGHVGIHYSNALPEPVRTALETWVKDHDTTSFIAPRSKTPEGVVLTFSAWNNALTCTSVTDAAAAEKVADAFFKAFVNKGPEAVPGQPQS